MITDGNTATNDKNRKDLKVTHNFWEELDDTLGLIPDIQVTISISDYNTKIGRENQHMGIAGGYPARRKTNKNGEILIKLAEAQKRD